MIVTSSLQSLNLDGQSMSWVSVSASLGRVPKKEDMISSVKRWFVVPALAAGIFSIFLSACGAFGPSGSSWSEIRYTAGLVGTPDGWKALGTIEEGSYDCFISCDSPRVIVNFLTNESASSACETIKGQVKKLGAVRPRSGVQVPGGFCHWYIPFDNSNGSSKKARIWAGFATIPNWNLQQPDHKLPRATKGYVVSVIVSSGL